MKKILIILITILFLPVIVNAKEYCTVVTGNGKDIGSEIACGSEHFYIFDNTGDEIKMLAKYNLYVGANYNKIPIDTNKTYIKYEIDGNNWINPKFYVDGTEVNSIDEWGELVNEKYGVDFELYSYIDTEINSDLYTENNKNYINRSYKYYQYEEITEDNPKYGIQNELARGVTGEKGNANYPIYATTNIMTSNTYGDFENLNQFENGYIDFDFKDQTIIRNYLDNYKEKLNNMGFSINNVNIMSISDINNFTNRVTNNYLPLRNWYEGEEEYIGDEFDNIYTIGDLKQYLSNDFAWIWNTSYWTRTMAGNHPNVNEYFISSQGEICYQDSCATKIPRAGLRPLITINKDEIKYVIKTKTDGNGTIEVIDKAYGGETITFKVTNKKGYKLTSLTIITDTGEKVTFSEEEIKKNADGTISISTNNFTMPYENITIQARWTSTIKNPITKTAIGIILFTMTIIFSLLIYANLSYNNNQEE